MALTKEDFQEIMDTVYDKIDSNMSADEVDTIVEDILDKYSVEDLQDAVTIGIFVGDVWRPVTEEEADDADREVGDEDLNENEDWRS